MYRNTVIIFISLWRELLVFMQSWNCLKHLHVSGAVVHTTSLQELDDQISAMMRKSVDQFGAKCWECLNCGKTCVGKNDIARHVESTHIDSPGISCHLCGKISKTRNALRNHVYSVHNVKQAF